MAYRDPIKLKEYKKKYNKIYKQTHKEYAKEYNKKNNVNYKNARKLKDDDYLEDCRNHIRSGYIVRKLKIKRDDFQIHHCFGKKNYNSFIYLPKDLHKELHLTFGQKNEDCLATIPKVKQWINKHKDEIIIIIDGEIKKTLE